MLDRYEWQRLKAKVRNGRPRESLLSFARQFAARPSFVTDALWTDFATLMKKINSAGLSRIGWGPDGGSSRHFYDFDPKAGIDLNHNTPTSRALSRLAVLDGLYRPKATVDEAIEARRNSESLHDTTALRSFVSRDLDNPSTYQEG
jgi:hypothetical protein